MSHILEFLDLVDTPSTYAGFPSRPVRVNAGASAVEFGDIAGAYVTLDTSAFAGLLSASEDSVQEFADLFDDLTIADFPDEANYLLADGTRELTGEWGLGGTYGISEINCLDFDLTPTAAIQTGRLAWNATAKTLEVGMFGTDVVLQLGQEAPIPCLNTSGGDIDNGEVVYVTGGTTDRPEIALSKADAKATTFVFGVATEDIPSGQEGYVTWAGIVRDIDTTVVAANGDIVFLSAVTAGAFTAAPAAAPNYKARVGYVIYKHATDGVLFVDASVVPSLRNLTDVETQAPAANDCPVWSSDNQWFDMTNIGGFFNGTFIESFDAVVTESGGTITMSLEQSGGGDLTMKFSGGEYDLDCTSPLQTIVLTAGDDDDPQANYIYILESTKVLTKSTTQWPATEHIKIGYFLVPSATYVASEGCYINQNWNDHRQGTDDQGHLAHLCEALRLTMRGATWHDGVEPNATGVVYLEITGTAPSTVYWQSTAGVCYQMHKHTIPAIDTSAGDDAHAVNWYGDPYHEITDFADIVDDANGDSLGNKYFNIVVWGVANKTGEYTPLMINLPTGRYNSQSGAEADLNGYDVMSMPHEFTADSCTGFLIARLTCYQDNQQTWTLLSTVDLRGSIPSASATGGTAGGALTDFPDNLFTIYDSDDVTRILDFDLSSITTANTRTITPADADMTLFSTTQYTDLTDSGETTLHTHADIGDGPWLPLTGGTLSGALTVEDHLLVEGGDIKLDYGYTLIIKDSGATGRNILSVVDISGDDYVSMGDAYLKVVLRGSTTRPEYDDNIGGFEDLALLNDVYTRVNNEGDNMSGDLEMVGADILFQNFQGIFMESFDTTSRGVLYTNPDDELTLGHAAFDLQMLGSETRPQYNGVDLALFSDAGGSYLPLAGGNLTGNLYIDTATSPGVQIRPAGTAGDRAVISKDASGIFTLNNHTASVQALTRIDPVPGDGSSNSLIQFFRTTTTTGTRTLTMYEGDGTATAQHTFNVGTGAVDLCQQAGALTVGGETVQTFGASEYDALAAISCDDADYFIVEDASDSKAKKRVLVKNVLKFTDGNRYLYFLCKNTSGDTIAAGDLCYVTGEESSSPTISKADASSAATASGMIVMPREELSDDELGDCTLFGSNAQWSGLTIGAPQYLSTTAGEITETPPSGDGEIVRVMGHAISATEMFFKPSETWVEIGQGLGNTISCLDIYDTGSVVVGATASDITFNTTRTKDDDAFTHSTSVDPHEVVCNYDGKVEVHFSGQLYDTQVNHGEFLIMMDTGSGYAEVAGTRTGGTVHASTYRSTIHTTMIIDVSAGDKIKVVGDMITADAWIYYPTLTMKYIEQGTAPAAPNWGVPATGDLVYADSSVYDATGSWMTIIDVTDMGGHDAGMLYHLYNDDGGSSSAQGWYFRVTVDGGTPIEGYTIILSNQVAIGALSVVQFLTPVFFTSSLKVEIGNYTVGVKYYRYAYQMMDYT